jgi:hypothetical protein
MALSPYRSSELQALTRQTHRAWCVRQSGVKTQGAPGDVGSLRTEPWIFVVDGAGIVRARFEGVTTRRELEAAVRLVLTPEPR